MTHTVDITVFRIVVLQHRVLDCTKIKTNLKSSNVKACRF